MGQAAFIDCTALAEIDMPTSLKVIEPATFRRCSQLASVEIPSSVTTISENAFTDCSALSSLSLPAGLVEIKDKAFANCTKLESIYYAATAPVSAPASIFPVTIYLTASLFVPAGYESAYAEVAPWKQFNKKIGHQFSGISDIFVDADNTSVEIYNFSGVKVADSADNLPAGTYIVRRGNSVSKLMIK